MNKRQYKKMCKKSLRVLCKIGYKEDDFYPKIFIHKETRQHVLSLIFNLGIKISYVVNVGNLDNRSFKINLKYYKTDHLSYINRNNFFCKLLDKSAK